MTAIAAQSRGRGGELSLLGSALPARRPGETIRWARFLDATTAEGPGIRSALWVQGCSVRCPGCFNPRMWGERGGSVTATRETAERWADAALAASAEGVTLLGGEPFDQADAVATVAETFRAAGLTVMAFSGYTLERLERWAGVRDDIARLLAATDLLCDGPYLRDLPDARRPWIGSRNQGIRALTPVYAEHVRRIDAEGEADRLEVRIGLDGTIAVNGWADDAALAALFDDLGGPAAPAAPRRRGAPTGPDGARAARKEVAR